MKRKADLIFLSENTFLGREPKSEEEKELVSTMEEHEHEIDPLVKKWYENELAVRETKRNIRNSERKIKDLDQGLEVTHALLGEFG